MIIFYHYMIKLEHYINIWNHIIPIKFLLLSSFINYSYKEPSTISFLSENSLKHKISFSLVILICLGEIIL